MATSTEAMARMKYGTRPDTRGGAMLHSTAMFGGYPVTNLMTVGRMFMSPETKGSRTKMVAALGLGALFTGTYAMQMTNLFGGKELYDLDDMMTADFVARALSRGGAFSIWGDFVMGAVNLDMERALTSKALGPVLATFADIAGAAANWEKMAEHPGPWTADILDVVRRNAIPETWWWSKVLQADILDHVDEWLDPHGANRSNAAQKRRAREQGTGRSDRALALVRECLHNDRSWHNCRTGIHQHCCRCSHLRGHSNQR